MAREFYWSVTIRCAQCGEVQPVDQPGNVPNGWVGVMVSVRLPATTSIKDPPRYEIRPYPTCGPACAAKLMIARALAYARTKAEREVLVEQLKEALGDGEEPKPN